MSNQKTPTQVLEEQKNRLANLQERRTRIQVKLESERKALQDAQAEAQAQFGTSDLAELRAMFKERQEENSRKVIEFVMSLDEVESSLTDIERKIQL